MPRTECLNGKQGKHTPGNFMIMLTSLSGQLWMGQKGVLFPIDLTDFLRPSYGGDSELLKAIG